MTYDKTIQDGFAPPKDMKYTLIRNMNILLDDKEKKSEAHVVEMSKHRHQKAKSISTTLTHVDKNKTSDSEKLISKKIINEQMMETPLHQIFITHVCFAVMQFFGVIREFLRKYGFEKKTGGAEKNPTDFPPLYMNYDSFYLRNCYMRGRDVTNRPICGVPGAEIELLERKTDNYNWSFYFTGKTSKAINMGSYNYLGFAENNGPCSKAATQSVKEYGVSTSGSRQELGTLKCHQELDSLIAQYLGVEAATTFGMGFGTNSMNIPVIAGGKTLILSDELNHTSLILGARLSGSTIRVFKHNDVHDLEEQLRSAIIEGQPSGRPWKKIIIVVEGIYSMEGTMAPLKEIINLKKKYKAYLYLDEAHSVGALGSNGRGIVDHSGCDPKDVDILMGTFSKSFGAAGGYIAGSQKLINFLKQHSHAHCYASSMSPPVCLQVKKTLEIIMGLDGTCEGKRRIKQLAENTKYFREKLVKMGFVVYGDLASPVVPVMLYTPTKTTHFSRFMLEKNIATVSVAFPATTLSGGRVRFCISAAHTREMLDKVLEAADECAFWNCSKLYKPHLAKTFQQLKEMDMNERNIN